MVLTYSVSANNLKYLKVFQAAEMQVMMLRPMVMMMMSAIMQTMK